jgi:hypothetical protein
MTKIEQLYQEIQQADKDRDDAVAEASEKLTAILTEIPRMKLLELHAALHWAAVNGDYRYRFLTAITKQIINRK